MFGHIADRERSSRWLLSWLLFAMLAWFVAMQDRIGEVRVGIGTTLAVAVGVSTLRVGVMLIGGRRKRRERKAGHADGDGQTDADQAAEEHRPTYEEIFGAPAGSEGPSDQLAPTGDGANGENPTEGDDHGPDGQIEAADDVDGMTAEVVDGAVDGEVETADGEAAEWMSADDEAGQIEADAMTDQLEHPDIEVDVEVDVTDADEPTIDVEEIKSELESEEAVRRLREEFKARAQEAELRIKQRQAELEQASSAPTWQ